MLFPIIFPMIAGFLLLAMKEVKNRKWLTGMVGVSLALTGGSAVYALSYAQGREIILFHLTRALPVYFRPDALGLLFVAIVSAVWTLAGFFSFAYMAPGHGENAKGEKRFYGFYLMVFGVLNGLGFAGNLVTFYLFYELMTLLSLPLVLHTGTREAIMAGLKYLFYSLGGAYLVLFGLYFLCRFAKTLTFTGGGVLDETLAPGREGIWLALAFLMILGFGVKAGMFPVHAWLPTAHPVAPAPASAVLSSVIVKAGVLGTVRVVYYMFGADLLRGTWVQTVWLTLTLLTVFMGSMLAFRENGLKKRLAYSTVSQVSYILFGLALLEPQAVCGAMLHMTFHAFIKCGLFLTAGTIIHQTGKTKVDELRGIGKTLPVTMWCFTLASFALVGIPPANGFISKWYLAQGALSSGVPVFSWLGPVVLLISALLTAGYLFPVAMRAFFPGSGYLYPAQEGERGIFFSLKKEGPFVMMAPLLALAALSVLPGIFPERLVAYISEIVMGIL